MRGTPSVVHLCDYASPYPGSFVPMVRAVQRRVIARGWRFDAVFGRAAEDHDWYRTAREEGMSVRAVGPLGRGGQMRWIASLIEQQAGPVIIHTHFAGWDLAAALAARGRRHQSTVVVVWHRHGTLSGRAWPVVLGLFRFGLVGRAVDAHLCVGPGPYAQLLARGSRPARTLLVPNPVDVSGFRAVNDQERSRARAELGLDPGAVVLVAFTWRWELKGGRMLVEVVRALAERGHPVTALAVGGGAPAVAAASDAGLERRLFAVPERADPRVFYAAADVFLAAGRREGFGFAPLEAVCCGTPVVASDIPAHRYHGSNLPAMRLICPAPGAMADAVERELGPGRHDLERRIAASRTYLEQHAGLDAWSDRVLHVYDAALAGRGTGPIGRDPT